MRESNESLNKFYNLCSVKISEYIGESSNDIDRQVFWIPLAYQFIMTPGVAFMNGIVSDSYVPYLQRSRFCSVVRVRVP